MTNVLNPVPEDAATGKVAEVYKRIREGFQIDFVPNFFKAQATNPDLLETTWDTVERILVKEGEVPRTLKELMFSAISRANSCAYCEAAHLAFCKVLGVDKTTRDHVIEDLESLRPVRNREIIRFAIKAGSLPSQLEEADYQKLWDEGITDAELQEIIAMTSFATYANIIADSLKITVDDEFHSILTADDGNDGSKF